MSTGRKTMIPARPTTYNGVEMRSRLEAGFAQWLDGKGFAWRYEPECFASPDGQWLPDFVVEMECVWHNIDDEICRATPVYVEVKPASLTIAENNALRPRMGSLYASGKPGVAVLAQEGANPAVLLEDTMQLAPVDWSWTGLWPVDARRAVGPWEGEWWKGVT